MYSIKEVSDLSGISKRTLRYYDQINLLKPHSTLPNSYRVYSEKEIDRLQLILLYKELDFKLDEISIILNDNITDIDSILIKQKSILRIKMEKYKKIISTIDKTIAANKGGTVMSSKEKFKGLVEEKIEKNEDLYGEEIRKQYGEETIENSYKKMRKLSRYEQEELTKLNLKLNNRLKLASLKADPNSKKAQEACALHKEWIQYYWPSYSKEAHLELTKMYIDDERFTAYYDKISKGSAKLLHEAMKIYLSDK